MNRFFQSLTTKDTRTENNMPTHSTSGSFVVDLFYAMGGYRKNASKPLGDLVGLFFAAYGENPNLAMKCLLNLRDPRGGMGERNSGRILWHFLAKAHPEVVEKLIPHIPAMGRWDDLFYLLDTPCEESALGFLWYSLQKGDALAAKWTPRENKIGILGSRRGEIAKKIMKRFHVSPKEYRQILSRNTKVVETLMCENRWNEIKFSHVPSNAMKNYYKAFQKHEEERFAQYLESVKKGEAKINTSVLTPVDILHRYWGNRYNVDETLEVLWSNLKDVVPENLAFLPISDVSGSMNGTPMEVSVSLGIYLAQRNKSIFKNGFITFSAQPKLQILTGKTLRDNINQIVAQKWGMNTDLEAVFQLILNQAVKHNLPQEDMPTHLLIISDMQFDQCMGKQVKKKSPIYNWDTTSMEVFDNTAMEMIDRMYQEAGYTRPNIIFWNVRTSEGIPAKITDNGIGLVSGYSPNLLSSVLRGDLNPISQVMAILNNGRYDFVNEVL